MVARIFFLFQSTGFQNSCTILLEQGKEKANRQQVAFHQCHVRACCQGAKVIKIHNSNRQESALPEANTCKQPSIPWCCVAAKACGQVVVREIGLKSQP